MQQDYPQLQFHRPSTMSQSEMVFAEDTSVADFLPSHSESEGSERCVEEPMSAHNEKCANDVAFSNTYILFNAG